jgi:thymidine phosphorylase
LHTDEGARFERAIAALDGAVTIGDSSSISKMPLVLERISE